MIDMNMNIEDVLDVFDDVVSRNNGKKWENINYTDKYNIIVCCRILKKEMESEIERLNNFVKIPLEYIKNDRINQKQADMCALKKLIK